MLAVGWKPGGPFKRVDKGTYPLADAAPNKKATVPRPKRQAAARAKKVNSAKASS
jgi:hypothetical protein